MTIRKAYKVRLYPNRQQEQRLLQTVGACRFVWNYFLEQRKKAYLESGKTMRYHETCLKLTQLKLLPEFAWIDDVQTHQLQQSLSDLDFAYQQFFKKLARYPRFKTKKDVRQSFRKPAHWRIKGCTIALERGLAIRFRGTALPENVKWKSVTVSRDNLGRWYASMLAEIDVKSRPKTGSSIGIDLGLHHLAITSNGKKYDNLKPRKDEQRRMKRLQQSLCRKQKGSKRRQRARIELALLHQKIANRRMNHLHQVSHRITRENQAVIVCENLSVKTMLQNRRLSNAIGDTGWGEFIWQLEYKQAWRGGEFRRIGRFFPSSKTCSNCSFILESLPLSVREWKCPRCKTTHDRDVNAAKMVLKQGLRNSPCVESTDGSATARRRVRVTGSVKREVSLEV